MRVWISTKRFSTLVEKVDSPIGDENADLRVVTGRADLVEKVDYPIGDENCA